MDVLRALRRLRDSDRRTTSLSFRNMRIAMDSTVTITAMATNANMNLRNV